MLNEGRQGSVIEGMGWAGMWDRVGGWKRWAAYRHSQAGPVTWALFCWTKQCKAWKDWLSTGSLLAKRLYFLREKTQISCV